MVSEKVSMGEVWEQEVNSVSPRKQQLRRKTVNNKKVLTFLFKFYKLEFDKLGVMTPYQVAWNLKWGLPEISSN